MSNRRDRQRTLLVVEGDDDKFFIEKIFLAFPQLKIKKDSIYIYKSNIYNLYSKLVEYYGEDYLDDIFVDIDLPLLIDFVIEGNNYSHKDNYTDIYLIFDYERQDSFFDVNKISKFRIS